MNITFNFSLKPLQRLKKILESDNNMEMLIVCTAMVLAAVATAVMFMNDWIVLYGDAESHLNIAKRVIDSITPGAAQLGGIWLPIPHLLLIPFVSIDFLWRTGVAGSIVSGVCFIVSGLYLYKTTYFITKDKFVSAISFLAFALNPNILYLQSTPMTELVLIMFFILSSYYFLQYVYDNDNILYLIYASFFAFCATLSRYDGWFLVVVQAGCIMLMYIWKKKNWKMMEGKLVMYSTLAFFGIALWFLWGYLILGDPLYFTNSQFSARSQQKSWQARGELPSYHNLPSSLAYYFVTSMSNSGVLIFIAALFGLALFIKDRKKSLSTYVAVIIMLVPFIFNVTTLFLGQSVIFIPHLTDSSFEWTLFNVRYGVMMIPAVGFFFGYLFYKRSYAGKALLVGLIVAQIGLYLIGFSRVVTFDDGYIGLSHAKRPTAELWLASHYDGGLVLMDDYARTISVLRSGIPMQSMIYIGNDKYWEDSLTDPGKYARWVVMQKNDTLWNSILDRPVVAGRLYKDFEKVYTSPEILIFRKIDRVQ
ncbi:hypothetical protein BH09PAT2_BH09PAT2_01950 [soil metagenome]